MMRSAQPRMEYILIVYIYLFMQGLFQLVSGTEIWRYSAYGGISTDQFSVSPGRKVALEYLGSESITWEVDASSCTVSDSQLVNATLVCSLPGLHEVILKVDSNNEEVTRYLRVKNLPECFEWNAVTTAITSSGVDLQVWISDLNENATVNGVISEQSSSLTKQFALLGLFPKLSVYGRGLYEEDMVIGCSPYSQTLGYWSCRIEKMLTDGATNVLVSGEAIPLLDCSVRNSFVSLNGGIQSQTAPAFQVTFTAGPTDSYIVQNTNINNLAVLVKQTSLLLTEDSFDTTATLLVPALASASETLVDVAFSMRHLVVLTDVGLYFVSVSDKTLGHYFANTDISADSLVGIRGWDWPSDRAEQVTTDEVIVWSSRNVYLVKSDGTSSALALTANCPAGFTTPTVAVIDAGWAWYGGMVGVLATVTDNSHSEVCLFLYNNVADTWSTVALTITPGDPSKWHVNFLNRGETTVLVWGEQTAVKVTGETAQLLSLSDTATLTDGALKQLVLSATGDIVFLTTSNTMLYGRASNEILLQVPLGELPTTEALLWFGPLNQLLVVTPGDDPPSQRALPLQSEVTGALYPNTSCQVVDFTHNLDSPSYYVDKNSSLTLWAALVYRTEEANEVKLYVEGIGRINVLNNSVYSYHGSLAMHNVTVVIYHKEDYTNSQDYLTDIEATKAHLKIELNPENENLACPIRRPAVSSVSVDCPPERQVKIRKDAVTGEMCDKIETFTVRKLVDGVLTKTMETYDWSALGCPVRLKSGHPILPRLDLYDGDTFVEEVSADFVLREEFSQSNIVYNTTAAQAGCLRKAQTWESMTALAASTGNVTDVWGPHNYEPCFFSDTSSVGLNLGDSLYQIFNSSNTLALKFSMEYDGIYVFTATIIGRNYSFCPLTTRFAIQVHSTVIIDNLFLLGMSLAGFTGAFLILLIASYFRFRRISIREQEEQEQMTEEHVAEVKLMRESGLLIPSGWPQGSRPLSNASSRVST